MAERAGVAMTPRERISAMAEARGYSLDELKSHKRNTRIVRARDEIALYLRQQGWSLAQIGKAVNRDHTSVLDMLRRVG